MNSVPRQSSLIQQLDNVMVVDGCHYACAKRLLEAKGIEPDVYLNLEEDLQLIKQGPFSSLAFAAHDVNLVADAIIAAGEESQTNALDKAGRRAPPISAA